MSELKPEVYTLDPERLREAFRQFYEAVRRDKRPAMPRLSREAEEMVIR